MIFVIGKGRAQRQRPPPISIEDICVGAVGRKVAPEVDDNGAVHCYCLPDNSDFSSPPRIMRHQIFYNAEID